MINNQPTFVDGFYPNLASSAEECEKSRIFLEQYLHTVDNLPTIGNIFCGDITEIRRQFSILQSVPI
jgi:hypothetical protein